MLQAAMRHLAAMNRWASRNALATAVAVSAGKNCVCDLAVQCGTDGPIDWRRNGIFVAFGVFYVSDAA